MPTLRPLAPATSPDTTALGEAQGAAGTNPSGPAKGQPANPQKFKVDVGPSAIDGQGAFAGEPIPARRKIGEIRGEFIDMATARARAREA